MNRLLCYKLVYMSWTGVYVTNMFLSFEQVDAMLWAGCYVTNRCVCYEQVLWGCWSQSVDHRSTYWPCEWITTTARGFSSLNTSPTLSSLSLDIDSNDSWPSYLHFHILYAKRGQSRESICRPGDVLSREGLLVFDSCVLNQWKTRRTGRSTWNIRLRSVLLRLT